MHPARVKLRLAKEALVRLKLANHPRPAIDAFEEVVSATHSIHDKLTRTLRRKQDSFLQLYEGRIASDNLLSWAAEARNVLEHGDEHIAEISTCSTFIGGDIVVINTMRGSNREGTSFDGIMSEPGGVTHYYGPVVLREFRSGRNRSGALITPPAAFTGPYPQPLEDAGDYIVDFYERYVDDAVTLFPDLLGPK